MPPPSCTLTADTAAQALALHGRILCAYFGQILETRLPDYWGMTSVMPICRSFSELIWLRLAAKMSLARVELL